MGKLRNFKIKRLKQIKKVDLIMNYDHRIESVAFRDFNFFFLLILDGNFVKWIEIYVGSRTQKTRS